MARAPLRSAAAGAAPAAAPARAPRSARLADASSRHGRPHKHPRGSSLLPPRPKAARGPPYLEARLREQRGRHAAARARADHHRIAVHHHVAVIVRALAAAQAHRL